MSIEKERNYFASRLAIGLAGLAAGIGLFTIASDMVSAPNNLAVGFGFTLMIVLIVGGGYLAWLLGLDVARHFGLLAIVIVLLGVGGCMKVPPGFEGIRINMYGKMRGVQDLPIVTGRVWYNPVTEQIEVFPTSMQTKVWTASLSEGRANVDESITFTSAEGAQVNADISVAYTFEASKIPEIYLTFKMDPDALADTYIRARVRDAFVRNGPAEKIMDIVGAGNGKLLKAVKDDLLVELGAKGILLDYVSIIGKPRIPDEINAAIERAIQQTQDAITAQNKVAQMKAEADQAVAVATGQANSQIAQARGDADARRERAQGEADAILLEAKAEAQAKTLVANALTPLLVRHEMVTRWSGGVPAFVGASGQAVLPYLDMNKLEEK
jgi:regulator of protease activity HflC (stomatin/prohibitin superfamily)